MLLKEILEILKYDFYSTWGGGRISEEGEMVECRVKYTQLS